MSEPHANDAIAIKQRTCQECGMLLRDAGEYHPYEFCLLRKAGILDPWQVVKRFCADLSMGEPPMYARIRDLPKHQEGHAVLLGGRQASYA